MVRRAGRGRNSVGGDLGERTRRYVPAEWSVRSRSGSRPSRSGGRSRSRSRSRVLIFTLIALAVCVVNYLIPPNLGVGVAPYEVAGACAAALCWCLRTNAGYDRWWEGRKLWGGIVNQSRNLAIAALDLWAQTIRPGATEIVRWIAAFGHASRRRPARRARRPPEWSALLGPDAAGEIAAAASHADGGLPSDRRPPASGLRAARDGPVRLRPGRSGAAPTDRLPRGLRAHPQVPPAPRLGINIRRSSCSSWSRFRSRFWTRSAG